MGVYIYTLRAKTRMIQLNGKRVKAHLFMYLCRSDELESEPSAGFFLNYNETRRRIRRRAKMLDSHIVRALKIKNESEVVIVANQNNDGVINYQDADVYINCNKSSWTDCYDFPGTLVGFLHVEGKRLVVKPESATWYTTDFRKGYCKIRSVVRNGEIEKEYRTMTDAEIQEVREANPSRQINPMTEAEIEELRKRKSA